MTPTRIAPSFFFNDTATTEIYTLSLHDALPIFELVGERLDVPAAAERVRDVDDAGLLHDHLLRAQDRKSTRLNSSHVEISYGVSCLKKKSRFAGRRFASGSRRLDLALALARVGN